MMKRVLTMERHIIPHLQKKKKTDAKNTSVSCEKLCCYIMLLWERLQDIHLHKHRSQDMRQH